MSGAFDWLDTLASNIGDVAGQAVSVAGQVATEKYKAEQLAAVRADQSAVPTTSPLQTAGMGLTVSPVLLLGGAVAVVALVLLLRK